MQNLYFVVVNPHDRKAKAKWLANQDLRAQTGQLGDIQGLQLDRLLGRGAFGAVYHGCWEGREVAVKMLQVGGEEASGLPAAGLCVCRGAGVWSCRLAGRGCAGSGALL